MIQAMQSLHVMHGCHKFSRRRNGYFFLKRQQPCCLLFSWIYIQVCPSLSRNQMILFVLMLLLIKTVQKIQKQLRILCSTPQSKCCDVMYELLVFFFLGGGVSLRWDYSARHTSPLYMFFPNKKIKRNGACSLPLQKNTLKSLLFITGG